MKHKEISTLEENESNFEYCNATYDKHMRDSFTSLFVSLMNGINVFCVKNTTIEFSITMNVLNQQTVQTKSHAVK